MRGGLFWGLSDLHKFHKGSATIKKSFGLQAGLEVAALGKQQIIRERPCRIYIYIYIYIYTFGFFSEHGSLLQDATHICLGALLKTILARQFLPSVRTMSSDSEQQQAAAGSSTDPDPSEKLKKTSSSKKPYEKLKNKKLPKQEKEALEHEAKQKKKQEAEADLNQLQAEGIIEAWGFFTVLVPKK